VAVDDLLRDLALAETRYLELLAQVLVSLRQDLDEVVGTRLYFERYLVPLALGDFGLQMTLLLSLAPAAPGSDFPLGKQSHTRGVLSRYFFSL
jgi:hypothetical protein